MLDILGEAFGAHTPIRMVSEASAPFGAVIGRQNLEGLVTGGRDAV